MGTYTNPIIPGFNPDPSITRVGKDFFLVTSTFDFFPGIPIYHSTDLIKWRLISHVLTRKSQLDIRAVEIGGGVWAPTIRYRTAQQEGKAADEGGAFYVCGSCFDRYRPQADERIWPRGWYAKCKERDIWDGMGSGWSELVYFDMVGFDQDLFWDDDSGDVYLSSTYRMHDRTPVPTGAKPLKDFAVHICKVDLSTGRCLTRPRLLRSSPSGIAEGSHIIKRGSYYYLFTAEGGTEDGHSEYVSRSKSGPLGPWESGGKIVGSGTGPEDEVQNTGHCDLVEDADGNWWAVLLAVRPRKRPDGTWEPSVFGRETFLIPVTWRDDWPILNNNERISLVGNAPGLYQHAEATTWRDDFADGNGMQLGWYRKSTPQKVDWSLTERPGWLRLWGAPYSLNTAVCSTTWLRKQTQAETTFETRIDFRPDSNRVEAGLVVWLNHTCFSSVGIRLADGKGCRRVVSLSLADGRKITQPLATADSEVLLVVQCGSEYRFGYREIGSDSRIRYVGSICNSSMLKEPDVGVIFTGMMVGLYAFGEWEAALVPADFAYAKFRPNSVDNEPNKAV
ncbi:uncharacterized protein PV09_05140 [Verruconis gallopava]|uniref:Beta-xylosidase C-terminal Concanavalin A-like domain-containing protein n=1 Tax=Verruconis gallopava TaxID=253628 RepID=A0A0D1XMQ1_9PEZI|nr:uncharacterized protein PV09_05140 [Verruconis gallopava]KIW03841.1 hypothetical protein PV09_05140 [Verruconis gallopava]